MQEAIHCCQYCGRDTRARSGICARCLGGSTHVRIERPARALQHGPIEDDYSEESGPDRVYEEGRGQLHWHEGQP